MDIRVLDQTFLSKSQVDLFESFIWTDRYDTCGDFEIYTLASPSAIAQFSAGDYLYSQLSPHLMIVENKELTTDTELGNYLKITGRSLESILERRIVWKATKITGNLQLGIKKLLDENLILATDTNRRISNFVFEVSTDPAITSLVVEAQFLGETLYDIVSTICNMYGIGFRVYLGSDNTFRFKLYAGLDRSFEQTTLPHVVFSPKYENLISSSYTGNTQYVKTVALVQGSDGRQKAATLGPASGLERKEVFIEASDLSQTVDEETLTLTEYDSHLQQRGLEELSKLTPFASFDGQADVGTLFIYGQDFYLGDIVQFQNEYGMESRSRVVEMVYAQDLAGVSIYPTFSHIEE